jgi:hypothetical protein
MKPVDRRVDLGQLPRDTRRVRRVELGLHRVRPEIGRVRRHHGKVSRTVLLVAVGMLVDRAIQGAKRSRPFFLEAARKMAALRLGERHRYLLYRPAMHICGRNRSSTLTKSRAFARFVR